MFGGTFGAHGLMAIVCASFLLSGCAIDLPIEPEPSVSIRPTEPPEMPDAAKGTDEDAAIAFAKHYIDVLSYAAVTGDTSYLSTLHTVECDGCKAYQDLYENTYSQGGYITREPWVVRQFSANRASDYFEFSLQIDSPPSEFRRTASSRVESTSAESFTVGVAIRNSQPFKIDDFYNLDSK